MALKKELRVPPWKGFIKCWTLNRASGRSDIDGNAAIDWAANCRKKVGMLQSISCVTEGKRLENLHGQIKVITQEPADRHVTASN